MKFLPSFVSYTLLVPLLAVCPSLTLSAAAPSTALRITNAGLDTEGLANFQLDWTALSNATYLVQSTDHLGGPWQTLDAVQFPDSAGTYRHRLVVKDSIGLSAPKFFRLVLPKPQISSVEPAVLNPGTPVDLYVAGQCFSSNDVLRINGIIQNNSVFVSSNLRSNPSFVPDVAGDYLVELVVGGQVLSSFHLTCADAFASPALVLQGPPQEPLASPSVAYLSKRGYDYYQAQSDFSSARLLSNPYFNPNQNEGEMPGLCFDVQEGKKGLNAVNVKSARKRDVGEVCDDGNDHSFASLLMPALMKAKEKANRTKCQNNLRTIGDDDCDDKDPAVIPFSGEVVQQVVDLSVEGRGLDFVWGRTYHSRIGRTGSSPNGWTFSYDINIQPLGGGILLHDGTGRTDLYKSNTNGTYTCPEFFREGTLSNNVFRLTFADTGYWEFNPLDGTAAAGALARIVDRNGNTLSLNYTSGKLTEIVDDLDRTNTIAYGANGQVSTVTDFSGRTVSYAYYSGKNGEAGGAGDLQSVTSPPITGTPNGNDFPLGKTTSYTYSTGYANDAENHLLLSVIDANGDTVQEHVYQHNQTDLEFIRCRSARFGTNPPVTFSYLPQSATPANQFTTLRCIINDAVGNVTECFYDARNRCVKLQQFTGRATAGLAVADTANRPAGKLRPSDPDYYECRAEWNGDSLCHRLILFGGQSAACVYESDFDPATSARKRADCRIVREIACCTGADTDGDGLADLTQREWHYDYDPRFGTDPTPCRGKKLYVGNLPFSATERGPRQTVSLDGTYDPKRQYLPGDPVIYNEALHTIESAKIITDRDSGRSKGFGFTTSETDARGNVSTSTYDSNGNLLQAAYVRKGGTVVACDFNYKEHSRLSWLTNAPDGNGHRRIDAFSYYTNGPQAGYLQSIAIDEPGVQLTTSFEYDERGNVTRLIDPRGNDCKFHPNAVNQCVRFESPTNLLSRCATDFFYDANNNRVQTATEVRDETDAQVGTRMVIRGFDRLHRLTRGVCSVDATHFMTNNFGYDASGRCVLELGGDAVSGADPYQAVGYQYDERGLLFRQSAAPGGTDQSTSQYDYNPNGLITRVSEGLESGPAVTSFEYDGFAKYTGRGERVQGYLGQKAKSWMVNNFAVHPDVASKKFDWAPKLEGGKEGLATGWTPQGVENDLVARVAKLTDPMGNVTTFNYDANDNLKVIRHFGETNDVPGTNGNVRLAEAQLAYDELNQCIVSHDLFFDPATQSPIGDGDCTTAFTYAPNSDWLSLTDDFGRVTTCTYDTAGRPSTFTAPSQRTEFAVLRDRYGNVTSCTQTDLPDFGAPAQVFAWTNVYDAWNRCVSSTDNVGNTNHCTYDSLNHITAQYNPKEYSLKRTTDWRGRNTLAVQDLDGDGLFDLSHDISCSWTWSSSSDRLLSTSDSHGNPTSYGYDSLDRCTSITNADNTRLSLVWSPRSNLIQETDANGTVVLQAYDLNDRCISNNITPGPGVAATTTFETFAFDGCSRLVAATNDATHCEFTYDSHGNCSRGISGGLGAIVTPHDSRDNRLSIACPGGKTFTYAYDVLDQCTNIMDSGVSIASFGYAGPGRVGRINYGNGARTQITYDGFIGSQNAVGDFGHDQISSVTHALPVQGRLQKSAEVDLLWDRNGNKSSRTDTIFAPAIPRTNTLTLVHDPADRLVQATLLSGSTLLRDTTYGLDQIGNRTNVTGSSLCPGSYFMGPVGALDFQMNQYTTTPCDSRTYDDNGNLLSRNLGAGSSLTYLYDYAGQLVSVTDSGVLLATYAYDPLGRRISKTTYSGGLPPVTTQFVYDGGNVIEERSGGGVLHTFCCSSRLHQAENLRQRAFEDRLSARGKHREAMAAGVSRLAAFSGTGALQYYFHADDQGNVLALTGPGANLLERYDYDDYGAVTFLTGDGTATPATSSPVGNNYCWHNLRLDAETGLQNDDGDGYFEPQTGRAVRGKVKTVKDMGGSNRSFGGNQPWSGGPYPVGMKNGTVKFFNETKGFGRVIRPAALGHCYAMYGIMK